MNGLAHLCVVLLNRIVSPSLAVIAVKVKIQIGRMTTMDKRDGEEVVWGCFGGNEPQIQIQHLRNICRLAIGHCVVNRGQWPQVTLVNPETHMMQGQGSQIALTPITSTIPIQVNRTTTSCIFSRFRWNLVGGCSSYDVITSWPDLAWSIFFT